MDAAAVFGIEVFNRQRIGDVIRIESVSLIPDHEDHSLASFAAATDMNQFAGNQAIAVKNRVTQSFAKREFDKLFLSVNAMRGMYQVHEPVR
jgi:hypothetical protein